jgi:hypothetical protein
MGKALVKSVERRALMLERFGQLRQVTRPVRQPLDVQPTKTANLGPAD